MAKGTDRRPGPWRWATLVVGGLCGAMFLTSWASADGFEWRPARYTDLAALVRAESVDAAQEQERARELADEVDALTGQVTSRGVREARRRELRARPDAGLTPVSGPAVTITLYDAPREVIEASTGDLNDLVVHQQDIQRVVNALWRGGARAVTIQGQRVVSTTGIKCEGNAIQLHGRAFPQPFVIEAVGDQVGMLRAVDQDSYLTQYRAQAADPHYDIGWELATPSFATAPAYDGPLDTEYAEPIAG